MGTGPRSTLIMRSILDHASELFDTRGYAETRLQDIADSVGLSRPTIYYYFKSKEDILAAMLIDFISVEKVLEPINDQSLGPTEKLRALMSRIGMQVVEKPAQVRIVDRYLSQFPRDVVKDFTTERSRLRRALTEALQAAIDAGEVRQLDAELNTSIIFGAITGIPIWYHSTGGNFDADALATVIDILLHGIVLAPDKQHDGGFDDVLSRVREDLSYLHHSYVTAVQKAR